MSTGPETLPPAAAPSNGRKKQVIGMLALALIGISVSLWLAFGHRGPGAEQQLAAFTATKPAVVSIASSDAPVITADDVLPAFFSITDIASPSEARMVISPLFDAATPKQVWLFAAADWAAGNEIKDLASLIDDLKARRITVVMILPPQDGETEEDTLNALAGLANSSGISFLDYHDGSKLGEALCVLEDDDADASMNSEALLQTLTTQQMLLHMAVNAPATRPVLKLADIGARIEKLKAEVKCGAAETKAE